MNSQHLTSSIFVRGEYYFIGIPNTDLARYWVILVILFCYIWMSIPLHYVTFQHASIYFDSLCRYACLELFDGTSGSSSYVNGEYACNRTWNISLQLTMYNGHTRSFNLVVLLTNCVACGRKSSGNRFWNQPVLRMRCYNVSDHKQTTWKLSFDNTKY